MATKKQTQLVITPGKATGNIPVDMKSQLEARAARFGMAASSTSCQVDQEKLAARAARFADIKTTEAKTTSITTATPNVVSNPANADMLAKRAARFADINNTTTSNKTTLTTTIPSNKSSIADAERLAKRAARFADIKAKTSK